MGVESERRTWPRGASREYVRARQRLLRSERELRDRLEEVAAQRRELPEGALLPRYSLTEGPRNIWSGDQPSRLDLRRVFGDHDTLVIYHLMYAPRDAEACPMCSMWIDGLNGVAQHVNQNTALAVVAKAPLPKLREWGRRRRWEAIRLLSSYETTFNADLAVESPDGAQYPAVTVLRAEGQNVRHVYSAQPWLDSVATVRGIDLLSPVWQLLDLLPQGRGSWYASNDHVPPGRSEAFRDSA
jgi:predicted dithiol-disulfide oxidoreductase (DUF899 family)